MLQSPRLFSLCWLSVGKALLPRWVVQLALPYSEAAAGILCGAAAGILCGCIMAVVAVGMHADAAAVLDLRGAKAQVQSTTL